MDLIHNVIDWWLDLSERKTDPRTKDWFMMSSPIPSIVLCFSYPFMVHIGKWLMTFKKEPFQLRGPMIVYNFSMVALSLYMVYEFLMAGWLFDYSLQCQPVDYSDSPQALRMASVAWWFYFSKFIEFIDTMFFVLRKKNNQITVLHVVHHGIMPLPWYFGLKFIPGGQGSFHGLVNATIHVFMYFYYGLSACGPQYQKYLWWKKYMTKMQMVQFVIIMAHAAQFFFMPCDYPIVFSYLIFSYAFLFMCLFSNFYIQEFIHRQAQREKAIKNDPKKIN